MTLHNWFSSLGARALWSFDGVVVVVGGGGVVVVVGFFYCSKTW